MPLDHWMTAEGRVTECVGESTSITAAREFQPNFEEHLGTLTTALNDFLF